MAVKEGMFYRVWGSGDKVALLIHGLSSSSFTWRKLGRDLAQQGYTVYAPDLKGHGKSDRARKYSIRGWAADISKLNIEPDLIVGHSMGGLIAAILRQRFSDAKVILVDPLYRLPHGKVGQLSVQGFFTQSMLFNLWFRPKKVPETKTSILREEYINLKRWDIRTVKALQADKSLIIKCLLSSTEVLLLRAKGSFILPPSILKRKFNENVQTQYFPTAGHNIHQEDYTNFLSSVNTFLSKNKISEQNTLAMPVGVLA